MDAKQRYEMWLGSDQVDDVTKQELVNIKDNEAEIEASFRDISRRRYRRYLMMAGIKR